MILLPAIDLYEGKAVRLFQGDYNRMTVYDKDPLSLSRRFARSGAAQLHLVDLEGARYGTTPHLSLLSSIVKESGLTVEVGGGIRTPDAVTAYLDAGVSRVILGTAAVTNPDFLSDMVTKYGDRIAVSVDCRDGFVAIRGWTEQSALSCDDFCKNLQALSVKTVICTDISRDGAMQGANCALYRRLCKTYLLNFIASGGVSSLSDIRALKDAGLYGAILGKAYYAGAVTVEDALEAAR